MKQPEAHTTLRSQPRGSSACAARLFFGVLFLLAAISPVAWWWYGPEGLIAAASAAALCTATSTASILFAHRFSAPEQALHRVMVGMALRMSVPLVVCLVIALRFSVHSSAGFVYFLLAFYLATLAFETWIALERAKASVGLLPKD